MIIFFSFFFLIHGCAGQKFIWQTKQPDSSICYNTPDGSQGQCIEVRDCPDLLKAIKIDHRTVLRSMCGQRSISATKVCCPVKHPEPVVHCGIGPPFKIINGENASIGAWPWAALLHYSSSGYHCGGSLIHEQYVLTAAHCFDSKRFKMDFVRLGENNLKTEIDQQFINNHVVRADPPQDIEPETIIIHPKYGKDRTGVVLNDIALIRLKHPVKFSEYVQPICLPKAENTVSTAVVVGWGRQGDDGPRSSILQQLDVPVVDIQTCEKAYTDFSVATIQLQPQLHICAGGEPGKDSCKGDSGGPLMAAESNGLYSQIGVVSFGIHNCGSTGVPGVYTNVFNYVSWIRGVMQSN